MSTLLKSDEQPLFGSAQKHVHLEISGTDEYRGCLTLHLQPVIKKKAEKLDNVKIYKIYFSLFKEFSRLTITI